MELKIDVLVEHSLDPNEYVYLYYLVHDKILPINMTIDTKRLELLGFVKILDNKVQVRQKAINLFKEIDFSKFPVQASEEPESVNYVEHLKKDVENNIILNNVDSWIESWRNLFPRGVKTAGYPVRGTLKGCTKKMKKFVKNNPDTTVEKIFNATKRYIEERRQFKYAYMKIADYFIEKDGGSLLDSYLEEDFIRDKKGQAPLLDDELSTNKLTDDI